MHVTQGRLTVAVISRRSVVTSIVAVVAIGPVTGTATATFPGRNGRIAYAYTSYEVEPIVEIVRSVNPNGSDDREVLRDAVQPHWSPSGHRILFERWDDEVCYCDALWLARADGTEPRSIITAAEHESQGGAFGSQFGDSTWSPGGRRIAYTAQWSVPDPNDPQGELPRTAIYTVRRDGTGARRLHTGESPAWSPHGTVIAFVTRSGGIATIRRSGTGFRKLVRAAGPDLYRFGLDVSPDGRQLLYQQVDLRATPVIERIGIVNLRGGRPRLLPPKYVAAAVWSPNGKRIAYAWQHDTAIRTIRPDGTHVRKLFALRNNADSLSWAPR